MFSQRFISSTGKTLQKYLKELLNAAHFVSLLSDGSTDSGGVEQEIIYVQYLKDWLAKTDFAGINAPDKVKAQGLLAAI